MFIFFTLICVFVINVNGDAAQRISRQKCEEYGNFTKANTCIESSGNEGRAKAGDFPHMALLGYNYDNKTNWNCAGVLISDQYILTVAHCITYRKPESVRLGELDIQSDEDNTNIQDVKISKIIAHPKYNTNSLYNDIALIKLEKPVSLTQNVRPACLPKVDENIDIANEKFVISGWGLLPKEDKVAKPYLLYNTNIIAVSYDSCSKTYSKLINLANEIDQNTQLCIGKHEEECQVISGSPIQVKDKDVNCMQQIIGVLSFATPQCKDDAPEVTTKVSSYVDWIEGIVWG